MNKHKVRLSLFVSMLLLSSNIYAESTMDGLGDLGGGAFLSNAYAINSDG